MLADRVKYEALAKAIIFMPMAISFVGAGVIWKFVYDYGTEQVQMGLLNAILAACGQKPVACIHTPGINTVALIVVGIWIWTGFCMTILSAAIKSVPDEILEAARVDGATEWSIFWRIMVPIIMPTIVVVITTMVINTLKIFDIVYVMTGGNYGTDVIANRMYTEMYKNFNVGHGHRRGGGAGARDHSVHLPQHQALHGAGGNPMNRDRINKSCEQDPNARDHHLHHADLDHSDARPADHIVAAAPGHQHDGLVDDPRALARRATRTHAQLRQLPRCGWQKLPTGRPDQPGAREQVPRSLQLMAVLKKQINGKPHMGATPLPIVSRSRTSDAYLKTHARAAATPRFTLNNYIDALVGYRGTQYLHGGLRSTARRRRISTATPATCSTRGAWDAPSSTA